MNELQQLQLQKDLDHLRLLAIFHYIIGGMMALFALFPAIYIVAGIIFLVVPMTQDLHDPPPEFMGFFFTGFGLIFMFFILLIAFLAIMTGSFLQKRKSRVFCIVVATVFIVGMNVFTTTLGVFSFIVLMRPSVERLFNKKHGTRTLAQ